MTTNTKLWANIGNQTTNTSWTPREANFTKRSFSWYLITPEINERERESKKFFSVSFPGPTLLQLFFSRFVTWPSVFFLPPFLILPLLHGHKFIRNFSSPTQRTMTKVLSAKGGLHRGNINAYQPAALGSISSVPKKILRKKLLLLLEVNQRRWLEENGQWLENVDRTHLVLAGSNPVLQKVLLATLVLLLWADKTTYWKASSLTWIKQIYLVHTKFSLTNFQNLEKSHCPS